MFMLPCWILHMDVKVHDSTIEWTTRILNKCPMNQSSSSSIKLTSSSALVDVSWEKIVPYWCRYYMILYWCTSSFVQVFSLGRIMPHHQQYDSTEKHHFSHAAQTQQQRRWIKPTPHRLGVVPDSTAHGAFFPKRNKSTNPVNLRGCDQYNEWIISVKIWIIVHFYFQEVFKAQIVVKALSRLQVGMHHQS